MNNKKDSQSIFIPFDEIEKIQKECNKSVIDLKYSLEVDPENKYSFDDVEKEFIKLYVEYKSIPHVANWLNLDENEAKEMYSNTFIQNEIKRITMALYYKIFQKKTLSFDELGGYLTSLLVDDVPESDKIDVKTKLKVVDKIIELNKLKQEILPAGEIIDTVEVSNQIKNLSIKSLKKLINEEEEKNKLISEENEKNKLIDELKKYENNLSPDDINELKKLPLSNLLELINNISKDT